MVHGKKWRGFYYLKFFPHSIPPKNVKVVTTSSFKKQPKNDVFFSQFAEKIVGYSPLEIGLNPELLCYTRGASRNRLHAELFDGKKPKFLLEKKNGQVHSAQYTDTIINHKDLTAICTINLAPLTGLPLQIFWDSRRFRLFDTTPLTTHFFGYDYIDFFISGFEFCTWHVIDLLKPNFTFFEKKICFVKKNGELIDGILAFRKISEGLYDGNFFVENKNYKQENNECRYTA